MHGSIEQFMSEVRDRISELASKPITSSQDIEDVSFKQIIDFLIEEEPQYASDLQDMFGVNDLLTEADENEVWDAICDNEVIYDKVVSRFPSLRDDISAATNVGNITIDPDLETLTGDSDADEDYYNEVLSTVENKLIEVGPEVKDIKSNKDSILIIISDDAHIHEYTVPFDDLTGNQDEDVNYILDAILSDLDIA